MYKLGYVLISLRAFLYDQPILSHEDTKSLVLCLHKKLNLCPLTQKRLIQEINSSKTNLLIR